MKNRIFYYFCCCLMSVFAIASASQAATLSSVGAGTAVSTVNAQADFESQSALFDNPYVEGGMSFSRTGLSFNNNGCGFAGCQNNPGFYSGSTPFMGNYMYGSGSSAGEFTIKATGSNVFKGLEMIVGTGNNLGLIQDLAWTTSLNGNVVGSGSSLVTGVLPQWYGWSDTNGFDTLVFRLTGGAPAFDKVRAEYLGSTPPAVPLPAGLPLLLAGLGAFAVVKRRRRPEGA